MTRVLSHSEVATALDCQAKHAFAYTGALTGGDALKSKVTHIRLREGRAWGAAVAAWHATGEPENAHVALAARLSLDAAEQHEGGVYDADEHLKLESDLQAILGDYIVHTERVPIDRLEHELYVTIPSRTGVRASTRYRLLALFDGVHVDDEGRTWIVEFKLRGQLTSLQQIVLDRQGRWYAWAYRRRTAIPVAGVIVDERLNQAPSPVRFNQNGTPSKVQSCRPDAYADACLAVDVTADQDVVDKLAARQWHARHRIIFRPGELDEAGQQIVSAAKLIHQLDTGELYPVRNPSRMRCPGCAFKDACPDPGDEPLVDALYDRVAPKRFREEAAYAA